MRSRISRRQFLTTVVASTVTTHIHRVSETLGGMQTNHTNKQTASLCFTSARELARLIHERKLSAREVMTAHLDQIRRINPKINAIVAKLDDDRCLALPALADT